MGTKWRLDQAKQGSTTAKAHSIQIAGAAMECAVIKMDATASLA